MSTQSEMKSLRNDSFTVSSFNIVQRSVEDWPTEESLNLFVRKRLGGRERNSDEMASRQLSTTYKNSTINDTVIPPLYP